MRVRLAACGVRAISNLVDVTNYVMLEIGHPLHAFDLDRLRGGIVQARRANRGEKLKTLDGVERPLQEGDVVIADGQGAIALAGVMGGAESEVSATTTAVLLEAATFDPRAVRRTAKRLGLHSEASHRFERGVDAEGVPHASRRAAAMLARLGGGALAGEGIDRYPQQQHPRRVTLSAAGLTRLAGFEIPLAQAAEKLAAIGIASAPDGADTIAATVPTFRPDVTIEEDLVEEVMRLVGYDRAPARLPRGSGAPAPSPEALADRARDALAAIGLTEIVSWGFVPRPWLAALGGGLSDGIALKNPISADYEVMRTSLLPGLVDAARRNLARSVTDVGLFEVGPIVRRAADPKEAPVETAAAAAILVGRRPAGSSPTSRSTSSTPRRSPASCCATGRRGARIRAGHNGDRAGAVSPRRLGRDPDQWRQRAPDRSDWRDPPAAPAEARASTPRRSIWRSRSTRSPASGARSAAWPRRASRPRRAISRSGSTRT